MSLKKYDEKAINPLPASVDAEGKATIPNKEYDSSWWMLPLLLVLLGALAVFGNYVGWWG